MYWGIDLAKIIPSSIIINKEEIIIPLPKPSELDFSIDPSSLKYISLNRKCEAE